MKTNFFKKENNFKKKEFSFHPNFFWRITLVGTLITILLVFIFSYLLFMKVNQEPILLSTNQSGQLEKINQDRIKKVLNYFSIREEKSNQTLNAPSSFVDPSL
jgi:hypothetical protein